MSKRIIEIAVGLFVIMGLIALLTLSLKVSGLNDIHSEKEGFEVTAHFDNIGGLKPRARVSIAGVAIGRVTEIYFDPTHFTATVKLRINSEVKSLPDDTQASILTSGLLGDNYIGLHPESAWSETFMKEGTEIPKENTNSAVILEELVSKFLSSKASQ